MNRLLSLAVSDVMGREVLTIFAHDTIEQAAAALRSREVSGAPVVDETGRCVGVLTAGDFIRRESLRSSAGGESFRENEFQLTGGEHGEPLHIDASQSDLVCRYMSRAVQTIRSDALLITAARVMDAEHIHRLIVVDEKGFPVGLVSSMDIVAAVVNSIDEEFADAAKTGGAR
jgi:CBS domain-containing protein